MNGGATMMPIEEGRTYGGLAGDPYWRQATNIYEHPLLIAHTPPTQLRAVQA